MNTKPLIGIGVAIAIVVLAVGAVFYLLRPMGGAIDTPRRAIDSAVSAVKSWGQNKIEIRVFNDTLECKPIGELALRRVRVRSLCIQESTAYLSTKKLIAHRSFDVKIGWDLNTDLKIRVDPIKKTVTVDAPEPKVLSVTGIEPEAIIIHREDGVVNKLTPEDMAAVMRILEQNARVGSEVSEARKEAKQDLIRYFGSIFSYDNYTTTVNFPNSKGETLIINSPALPPQDR